jgi:hypothetical protein
MGPCYPEEEDEDGQGKNLSLMVIAWCSFSEALLTITAADGRGDKIGSLI